MSFFLLVIFSIIAGLFLRRFTTIQHYAIAGGGGKVLTVVLIILFIRDPYRIVPYDGPSDLLYGMFAQDSIGISKSVSLFFEIEVLYYILLLFGLRDWSSVEHWRTFYWSVIYPFFILLSLAASIVIKMIVQDLLNFW